MSEISVGVNSILFGMLGILVAVFFGTSMYVATPYVVYISATIAILLGVVGMVASGSEKNKKLLGVSVAGIMAGIGAITLGLMVGRMFASIL